MSDFNLDPSKYGSLAAEPEQPGVGTPNVDPIAVEENQKGFGDYFKDVALAVPRGVEGAIQDTYNLADYISGDSLPDYNGGRGRVLGESETLVGGFVEGTANFLTGFVAPYAAIGRFGKIKGLLDLTFKAEKAFFAEQTTAGFLKGLGVDAARGAAAGAVADFVVFGKQDGNMSDMLNEYAPGLANPISDYLASDETDTELEGRLKNVLDGVAFGTVTDLLLGGIRYAKARNKVLRAGGSVAAATEAAEKASPPEQLIGAYHKALDAQYPGVREDVVWNGKGVREWTPDDFKEFGDYHGVENFGPLSPLVDVDGYQIPGGAEGKFTFYDLAWMRANPIDTRKMSDDTLRKVYTKLASTVTPDKTDTLAAFNRLVFSMLSPGTTLRDNEAMAVMARARSKEDVEKLASYIDWEPGDSVPRSRKMEVSEQIAKDFGWQSGAKGGIGIRNAVDLSNLAELSKLWLKDPEWFLKSDKETWQAFAERQMSQVRGLGAKTAAFGSVWVDPLQASIAAIDRHMAKEHYGKLFETKVARREWESEVLEEARAGGVKAKNFDEVLLDRKGSEVFTGKLMELVFNDRVTKMTGRNVPEGVQDINWIKRPKFVRTLSDSYRRAMAHNDEIAKQMGMGSFVTQWALWDRRRGKLEPHYSMFPGLEKIPRMSVDQIADSLEADTRSGLNGGNSRGLGTVNKQLGRAEDVASTVKFSLDEGTVAYKERAIRARSHLSWIANDTGWRLEDTHARIRERGPLYSETLEQELDLVRKFKNPETDGGRTFLFNGELADDAGFIVSVYSENVPVSELTPQRLRVFAAKVGEAGDLSNARIGVYRSPDGKTASMDFNVVLGLDEEEAAISFAKSNGQRSIWNAALQEEVVVNDVSLGVSKITDPKAAVAAAYELSSGKMIDPAAEAVVNGRSVVDAHIRNGERAVTGFLDAASPVAPLRFAATELSLNTAVFERDRANLVNRVARELYGAGDSGAPRRTLLETLERDISVTDPAVKYLIDSLDAKILSDVSLAVLDHIDLGPLGSPRGLYRYAKGEIDISMAAMTNGSIGRVTVHEMWHHISSYLSDDDLRTIENAFRDEREAAMAATPELRQELKLMDSGAIPHGVPLNRGEFYRYSNIDEWFAEKGTDRTLSRSEAFGTKPDATIIDKVTSYIRQWMANLMNAFRYKYGERTADVIFDRFFYTKDIALARETDGLSERVFKKETGKIPVAQDAKPAFDSTGGTIPEDSRSSLSFMRRFLKGVFADHDQVDDILNAYEERLDRRAQNASPKEGLNPRALDPTDLLAAQLKGTELNLTSYMMEDGPLQYLRAVETAISGDLEHLVPGLSREQDWEVTANRGLVELAVMTGGDISPEGIELAMRKYAGSTLLSARKVTARTHALKLGLTISTEQVRQLAEKVMNGHATDIEKADFLQKSQFHAELIAIVKGLDGEKGRNLNFNKAPIDVLALDKANFKALIEDAKSRGNVEATARIIYDAISEGGRNGSAALSRVLSNSAYQKGLDMTFEYWYGAILSGPKTFSTNALGSLMTSVYLPMETFFGGLIRADSQEMKQAMGELRRLVIPTTEIFQVAAQASRRGESALTPAVALNEHLRNTPKITANNVGLENDSVFGAAVNWLGTAVRAPGTILQYTDEVVKQANYRAVARETFSQEAMAKGIFEPLEVQNFVEQKMDRLMYEGQAYSSNALFKRGLDEARKLHPKEDVGFHAQYARQYAQKNWDPSLSALSQVALKQAQEATFQTPLASGSISATMSYVVQRHPMLRFVLPFVKTPVNILGFAAQRLDVASVGKSILGMAFPSTAPKLGESRLRFLQDMYGPAATPRTKAQATGRLAAGLTFAVTGIYLASTGAITGRGPSDPETRKILTDAGWLPYSIRVGNSYISYQKMDPFATILGVFADMYDFGRFDNEGDEASATQAVAAIGISLANNFTNKSYLTGISNFMEAMSDPERFMPQLIKRYAGSAVPSALNQSVTTVGGDEYVRETRSWLDAMMARVPGLSDKLPPARNMLGEPVTRVQSAGTDTIGQWADMWIPVAYQHVNSDTLSRELAVLKYPFSAPRKMRNGLDLTQFKNAQGQDAYDRWNEQIGSLSLGGKTLRARLTELVSTSRYQRMSPISTDEVTSPRVREIKLLLERYKSAAWDRTMREYPDLQGAYAESKTMTIQARLGITPKVLSH